MHRELQTPTSPQETSYGAWLDGAKRFAAVDNRDRKVNRQTKTAVIQLHEDLAQGAVCNEPFTQRLGPLIATHRNHLEEFRHRSLFPFLVYFDAVYAGKKGTLEREAIVTSHLALIDEASVRHKLTNHDQEAGHYLGTLSELLISCVVNASANHDNLLVPSFTFQNSGCGQSAWVTDNNHDGLYVQLHSDGWRTTRVQTKTNLDSKAFGYDPKTAIAVSRVDLNLRHLLPQHANASHPELFSTILPRILKRAFLDNSATVEERTALRILSEGLHWKFSSWKRCAKMWRSQLRNQRGLKYRMKAYEPANDQKNAQQAAE